jgi:SAM-dependent methyltransferase
VDGVACYETAKYFGEMPREKMLELVRDCDANGWERAIRDHCSELMVQYVADINRATWTSLLPLGPDSVALDVGAGFGAITAALARAYGRVVAIEPVPERVAFLRARVAQEGLTNVEVVQTGVSRLPFRAESFDLVVLNGILEWVGEWVTEGPPRAAQVRVLRALGQKLRPGGVMVIAIENRFGYNVLLGAIDHSGLPYTSVLPRRVASWWVKRRAPEFYRTTLNEAREYRTYTYTKRGYAKLLREAGLAPVEWWWPQEYNAPHVMFRLSRLKEIRQHLTLAKLRTDRLRGPSWQRRLKTWVLGRCGGIAWMNPDFVIMATPRNAAGRAERTRGTNGNAASSVVGAIESVMRSARVLADRDSLEVVSLITNFGRNRQVLQVARAGGEVLAVAKVANLTLPRADTVEREHEWLRWLDARSGRTLAAPRPFGLRTTGNVVAAAEHCAHGPSLEELSLTPKFFADRQRVRAWLRRVAQWCGEFHSAVLEDRASKGNVLALAGRWRGPEDAGTWPWRGGFIQHGDLYPGHVFVDGEERLVVIDWEDAGLGFPPMFDFFCFATGLEFSESGARAPRGETFYRRSFWDTYCERNWFSRAVREEAEGLCGTFGLSRRDVPSAFEEYVCARAKQFEETRYGKSARWARLYRRLARELPVIRRHCILAD